MAAKIFASLTAIVGGLAVIMSFLAAFGIDLSAAQQDAITALAGLFLVVAGVWFHPSVPVGEVPGKPPGE